MLSVWSLLCVASLASAKAVISCKDGQICKNLRIITSTSNEIPAELSQYNQAVSIDLHGNLMESFSGFDVRSARQLKALNLSYNLLKSEDLQNLGLQLEEIDITYNQLKFIQVPRSVKNFVAVRNQLIEVRFEGNDLEQLILAKNKLSKIPEISGQYKLIELDMSCNEISEVNFNTFSSLQNFKSLKLANNRIYQTTGDRPLNNLQNLDLSHNILTIIDESMESVSNVRELNLRNNQIVMFTAKKTFSKLTNIDFAENDWDCNSLNEFYKKYNGRSTRDRSCTYGNIESHGLCCSNSQSPYADRVIRYNKRNFEALQNSSAIRERGVDCANYKPNPCDGDDNEVYRVANAAASDTQSLISKNKEELEGVLAKQQLTLQKKEAEKKNLDVENRELQASLDGLLGYIQQIYRGENLQGETDPAQQLRAIFAARDKANKDTNDLVTEEERKLQNLLQDIAKNEEDLQELNDKKDRLLVDISARNQTIIEHEKKINELKVKLGRA